MKRKVMLSSLIAAGILTPLAATGAKFSEPVALHARSTVPAGLEATPSASQALSDFSWIAHKYGPAVVNISAMRTAKEGEKDPAHWGFSEDDPFYQMLRRFEIPMPREAMLRHGLGSGFIVSEDGYIMTNAHVVRDASNVMVTLSDNREFEAKVVGTDSQTDVAVLKIDATKLPTVKLGDPKTMHAGEWVVAMGSPYGFERSVAAGIVSTNGRTLPDGTYVPYIQTDVAINPGSSGGPLFNLKGEVIGINSWMDSRMGRYYGLSFAVPIDVAMKVRSELVQHGKVTRGRIGVTIQEVTPPLAKSFGMERPEGALVSEVEASGPADKAGLMPGDVILEIDGNAIDGATDLSRRVAGLKPGATAQLEIWRDGSMKRLTVTVGEMTAAKLAGTSSDDLVSHRQLGVTVRALTADERRKADVTGGLLVEEVDGAAAEAGVQPGDVILAMNSAPVKNAEELRAMVGKSKGTVALLVKRADAQIFIPIELG